ncbi:MAG: HlyD family type I secretion periplasmic adaptor subunit [Lautropia sp.]
MTADDSTPAAQAPRATPTPTPTPTRDEQALMSSLRAAQLVERLPGVHLSLYLMLAFVVVVIGWASIAQVDVVTRADGRVVPDGREQSIASLEGGILRELHVREGMEVEQGQLLAQLDPTRVAAMQGEARVRRMALLGSIARLQAEVDGVEPAFPAELDDEPAVVRSETDAYAARQRQLQDALASTAKSRRLLEDELAVARKMSADGMMSQVELMRLRRQVSELELQRQERVNRFRQEASGELTRARAELAALDEQLVVRDDVLRRTDLRSPVRGLVKNIRVATVGGVVAPGSPIMEIVPLGGRVLVEARIRPADIGFVREGQVAKVKLSAYEYNTYGGLSGTVEYISPDALGDGDAAVAGDKTWYRARIRADESTLRFHGEPLPVRPGMTGTVEVSTSDRSVLSFLLRPLLKSRDAFREQ